MHLTTGPVRQASSSRAVGPAADRDIRRIGHSPARRSKGDLLSVDGQRGPLGNPILRRKSFRPLRLDRYGQGHCAGTTGRGSRGKAPGEMSSGQDADIELGRVHQLSNGVILNTIVEEDSLDRSALYQLSRRLTTELLDQGDRALQI